MERDFEKTIGIMADKLKTAFIGSVDADGFPNIKAMLQPRKKRGNQDFLFHDQYFIDEGWTVPV